MSRFEILCNTWILLKVRGKQTQHSLDFPCQHKTIKGPMSVHLVLQQHSCVYKTIFDPIFLLLFWNVQNINHKYKTRHGDSVSCSLAIYACGLHMVFWKVPIWLLGRFQKWPMWKCQHFQANLLLTHKFKTIGTIVVALWSNIQGVFFNWCPH